MIREQGVPEIWIWGWEDWISMPNCLRISKLSLASRQLPYHWEMAR